MTEPVRAATPADAKAVWDSMLAAGITPTIRNVATSLSASGRFAKVSPATVHRWQASSWKPIKPRGDAPTLAEAAAKVDAHVPLVTGDPTSRAVDIVGKDAGKKIDKPAGKPSATDPGEGVLPPPSDGEAAPLTAAELAEAREEAQLVLVLREKSQDAVMREAAREAYITAILLLRRLQRRARLMDTHPREVGALQAALAGSITAANDGFAVALDLADRLMKQVDAKTIEGKANTPDPFDDVMAAIKLASDAHG